MWSKFRTSEEGGDEGGVRWRKVGKTELLKDTASAVHWCNESWSSSRAGCCTGALRCVNVGDKLPLYTVGLMATCSCWQTWTHTLANARTHVPHYTPSPEFTCKFASVCVCNAQFLTHPPHHHHDMPLVSGRISVIPLKWRQSCNFPPLYDRRSL